MRHDKQKGSNAFKQFTSEDGFFSLELPLEWDAYDDERNTYAFYNSVVWTGNLRITHFRKIKDSANEDNARKYIEDKIAEREGAIKMKLGEYEAAFYRENTIQDGEQFVIYYWMIGLKNNRFVCSFTTDIEQSGAIENELHTVTTILSSIKILP